MQLARHTYSLTPKRSLAFVPGVIAAVCAIAALGAAGYSLKTSHEQARKLDVLCAPPAPEQTLRDQLQHAQFALEQEAATRTALEQRAAQATAQIEKLQTDLAFLKKQR
ncbi:hypothetical protein [Caballeronia sp. GAWG1-1]|nr:hypothetical protein [Caballeronia sp. GAWG1-1]